MSSRLARGLATMGGLGDRLPAPGTTAGSLVGAALCYLALRAVSDAPVAVLAAGLAILVPVGVWACGAEARRRGAVDPGPVVLDEVAGQWLALGLVATLGASPPAPVTVVVSFLLFRVADVVKPWPIRLLERLPGGWGIMADDLAAGLLAALVHVAISAVL